MPIGSLSVYPEIIRLTLLNNPKSVLDVGIGYGINGAGIRNWFNDATKRSIKIVGIEPWKGYENPNWKHYDHIVNQSLENIFGLVTEPFIIDKFNVILCTDVCEHWKREDIEQNINTLKSWLAPNGVILMSTPAIWIEQGEYEGNTYETHHVLWDRKLFEKYGFTVLRDEKYSDPLGHKMLLAEFINR